MSQLILFDSVANVTDSQFFLAGFSTTHSPQPPDSSLFSRFLRLKFDPMNDYLEISQNIFLIVSNFFMLPVIYLAIRCRFRGEAIIYVLTMLTSSFYHLCDNTKVKYCIVKYETLQFLDFYCAILTLWVTAIILANVPFKWISSYQLGGCVFFAFILRNNVVGSFTFIVPAFCSIALLGAYWGHKYYQERTLPAFIFTRHFIVATCFTFVGILLFAIQQNDALILFYGFTHSAWHVCMAMAITFLLPPPTDTQLAVYYRGGKSYTLKDSISKENSLGKRHGNDSEAGRENYAYGQDPVARMESISQHI